MKSEAAVLIGLVEAAVIAVIGVLAYVVKFEPELTALLITAASAIVVMLGAVLTRSKVWSEQSVDALLGVGGAPLEDPISRHPVE